jgi:hypothetical protein
MSVAKRQSGGRQLGSWTESRVSVHEAQASSTPCSSRYLLRSCPAACTVVPRRRRSTSAWRSRRSRMRRSATSARCVQRLRVHDALHQQAVRSMAPSPHPHELTWSCFAAAADAPSGSWPMRPPDDRRDICSSTGAAGGHVLQRGPGHDVQAMRSDDPHRQPVHQDAPQVRTAGHTAPMQRRLCTLLHPGLRRYTPS